MKLLVSGCIGWSFVYMLNNTGDSTLPGDHGGSVLVAISASNQILAST